MNSVIISGNLGHTPELKKTKNGISVVTGSIGTHKMVNGVKVTQWFNFKAFNATAELIARSFEKGDKIGLIGALDAREYTDRDGNKKTAIEILVSSIEFYNNSPREPKAEPKADDSFNFEPVELQQGDLPF